MSRPLRPDVVLSLAFFAICSRNRCTLEPGSVIAELPETAGARTETLARTVGGWAGYYDDEHSASLVAAIVSNIAGATEWSREVRARRFL